MIAFLWGLIAWTEGHPFKAAYKEMKEFNKYHDK